MESQSRRARCISIAWALVDPAHVSGQDWMRFDSDRPMVWEAVGQLWGIRLALAILFVNIIGDLVNVVTRHDYRSLLGLPIAGAMIFYLAHLTTGHKTH